MKKRLGKNAYFFLIDSILALGILVIGGFIVYSSYTKIPAKEDSSFLSETAMGFFTGTKIKNLNSPYAGLNGQLWQQGIITNEDNTLLQQIGVFYAKNDIVTAEKFISNITENTIPKQYLFEFRIDDQLLYPRNPSQNHLNSKASTQVLIPSRKLVHGFLNEETGELFGPYSAEVLVWKKAG